MQSAIPQSMPTPPAAPMAMGGVPTPPPAPQMAMGGAMPMQQPMGAPMYNNGGETAPKKSNSISDFFSDINLVEAGLLSLGIATFLYAIYYYKFEMTMAKTGYADLNARMQKLESSEAKRKAAEVNAAGKNGMKPRRRVMI